MTENEHRQVFIVLGLYRPDPVLLSRQIQSLVSQTHRNLQILVCADGELDPASRAVVAGFAGSPIHVLGFDERVGIHANFARGMRAAVAASGSDSDLFAFCDQDDFWHPDKLQRQLTCFADSATSLCHSDARIVSERGEVLVASLFEHEARPRATSFADLLIMNSVSGMSAIFRRDVAAAAAPFPLSGCRYVLHDYWTALVAVLLGGIRFIETPLVDYTQHAGNVMGARRWRSGLPRELSAAHRRAYLRKCYREYIWRRRALGELRRLLGELPDARRQLDGESVGALFDCGSGWSAGLGMSLAHRLRGENRQADQIWRLWRGRSLFCASP